MGITHIRQIEQNYEYFLPYVPEFIFYINDFLVHANRFGDYPSVFDVRRRLGLVDDDLVYFKLKNGKYVESTGARLPRDERDEIHVRVRLSPKVVS